MTFRPTKARWIFTLACFALVLAFTIISIRLGLSIWLRVFFGAFSLFAVAAIIELALARVELRPDGVAYVRSFRSAFVRRDDIDSVAWEKGGGVALKLIDRTWVKLPEVGPGSQSVTNSIRAWLNRRE